MDTKQIMAKLDDAFKLHQKGDLAAAEKIYLEALTEDQENLTALNAYGALLVQLERFSESKAIFDKAIDIAKNSQQQLLPALLNSRGNMHRRQNNMLAAVADYKESCTLNPNYTPATNNLASAYLKLDSIDKAIETYKKAIALDPKNTAFHLNLAIAYIKKQQYDLARIELKQSLTLAPHNLAAMCQLAELELLDKNYKTAKDIYYKYTESKPFDIAALTGLAQCMIETDEVDPAITVLENILEQDPQNPDANYFNCNCANKNW